MRKTITIDMDRIENPSRDELMKAVMIVNAAIRKEENKYKEIAAKDGQEPVLLEGITSADCPCQLMVDPKMVADIFLRYGYPTRKVLEQDAPEGMWGTIANLFGIEDVCTVDL